MLNGEMSYLNNTNTLGSRPRTLRFLACPFDEWNGVTDGVIIALLLLLLQLLLLLLRIIIIRRR